MKPAILHHLPGPTHFLRLDPIEVSRHLSGLVRSLPSPRAIYFRSGAAGLRFGFPLLYGRETAQLAGELRSYLEAEERLHVWQSPGRHRGANSAAQIQQALVEREETWSSYANRLSVACENVAASTYAQDYPEIFWLYHSSQISDVLHRSTARLTALGATNPESMRYSVLYAYLDRAFPLVYDLTAEFAIQTGESEHEIFPSLLSAMSDNVLILTEPRIGPNLDELTGYFDGYLKQDLTGLGEKRRAFGEWHDREIRSNSLTWKSFQELVGAEQHDDPLMVPGYLTYASTLRSYPAADLFDSLAVRYWERLVLRLKEYELMDSVRRLMVQLEPTEGGYSCAPDQSIKLGAGRIGLVTKTRPIDFMAAWLVDPEVSRGGLMYDITDFTASVTMLARGDGIEQEMAFRALLRFQRHFDQLALAYGLRFEKYLGDGAFYSAIEVSELMVCAVRMQRLYRQFVADGFQFERGLRLAINYGDYRLMPFGDKKTGVTRYETVGNGVVELTRLVSGKSGGNLDEIKAVLRGKGYSERQVEDFFRPFLDGQEREAAADFSLGPSTRERRYAAFIDGNGTLVNEGIVATGRYLERVQEESTIDRAYWVEERGRRYVAIVLEHHNTQFTIGLRKLGVPSLKGIDPLTVYEVVDGEGWGLSVIDSVPEPDLIELTAEAFHQRLAEAPG